MTPARSRLCHDDGSIDASVDALFPKLLQAVAAGTGPAAVDAFHKLLPNNDDAIVFLGAVNLFRECAPPPPLAPACCRAFRMSQPLTTKP